MTGASRHEPNTAQNARTGCRDVTREEWRRIKTVAAGALEQPEEARGAYLSSSCGEDDALRVAVESLLESTAKATPLFESPAVLIGGARALAEAFERFDRIETSRVGERIGSYRLVRDLGGGGMGSTYLAHRDDEAYERAVAIKILKRGMDTDAILRRFRHERQILADLDHPNVARLLDGGTTGDGLPYFVMEYVDGVRLDRYCRERDLTIAQRVALCRQVCDAVDHAHTRRVIHRDLKPANILVTSQGVPKLLDFGISKVLTPDPDGANTEPTAFARAMTPQYASPEQVRGEPVTESSDVYSLGVVLYELLTGERPYRLDGHTVQETEQIICVQEPRRPSAVRRELAGDLDTILLMALRKEPSRRYASVRECSEDLQRHLDGRPVRARGDEVAYRAGRFLKRHRVRAFEAVLLALVIAVATAAVWTRRGEPAASATFQSVAVLPFTVPQGSGDAEYLSDGLSEGLIAALARIPRLNVLSTTTVRGLKGKTHDPQAAGKALNAHAIVLGSVSQTGDAIALSLELVDTRDGRRVWRNEYTDTLQNLAGLRDRIVHDVAQRLGVVDPERTRAAAHQSSDSEAYQLYLKGRYVWNKRTEDGFTRGLDYFRQALARDPKYALAYTGIADCYNLLGVWGAMSPHEAMPRVKEAALNAITLDNTLAEAHTSLAFVHWVYDWDWAGAEREFQAALQLDPAYATAHDWYAYYLASLGRFDEALSHITRAQTIEPVSLSISTDVGEIYYWSGQYERAIEQLRGVLQVEPDFPMARNILGLTYLKTGDVTRAVSELEVARKLSSGPRTMSTLAYGYGLAGSTGQARMVLDELIELSKTRYTSAFALALAYAGAGDRTEALSHLEAAFDERSDTMAVLRVYPVVDALRNEPRFKELLRKVGSGL